MTENETSHIAGSLGFMTGLVAPVDCGELTRMRAVAPVDSEELTRMRAVFDRVKNHLLAQKTRPFAGIECKYRGPRGLKCAVGCLIDDEHYSSQIEGYSIATTTKVQRVLERSLGYPLTYNIRHMLAILQKIHDKVPEDLWEDRLAELEV